MIAYFLEQTQGKIPMSFTDVQSPLNGASALVDTNNFYLGIIDDPDAFQQLLTTVAELTAAFLRAQQAVTGDARALPGHGFASSQVFHGLGMSADNMVMLSPRQYQRYEVPAELIYDSTARVLLHNLPTGIAKERINHIFTPGGI